MTLDARLPEEPGPWTIVRIDPAVWPDAVFDQARRADYTVLIAPETMSVLASLASGLDRAGAGSLGSRPAAIELAGDKLRLSRWLEAQGIATPTTRLVVPADGLPAEVRLPAVLKPIDGAGSVDTFYVACEQDLVLAASSFREAILQPYHAGIPLSASFLVDEHGHPWLVAVGAQKIEIRQGRFEYHGGQIPWRGCAVGPRLNRAVASVPGLRGFVGADFLWDAGSDEVIVLEINPRATTSVVGLTRLLPPGFLARAWLAACGVPGHSQHLLGGFSKLVNGHPGIAFDPAGNTRDAEDDKRNI
jgi:predicted ATP-grasp superfamily ATP-dependent carboligase